DLERTREIEAGVDVGWRDDRVGFATTVFEKRTHNGQFLALMPLGIGGFGPGLSSSGVWRTRGVEATARAEVLETRWIRIDATLSATTLRNTILSLGNELPVGQTTWRVAPGYPIWGAWGQPLRYADSDRNGVLSPSEITVDTGSVYVGSRTPTREIAFAP